LGSYDDDDDDDDDDNDGAAFTSAEAPKRFLPENPIIDVGESVYNLI